MSQAKIEALARQFDPLLASLLTYPGTEEDRAAIWGQSEQEANANPAAEEVRGSTHMGIGLIQWTGPRHTQLIQFAQGQNKPWQDTATQVRFIAQELNGPYAHIWKQIREAATTLRSKVETAMGRYEGPAGWQQEIQDPGSTTANLPKRLRGAQWVLAVIKAAKPGDDKVTDTSNVPTKQPVTDPAKQLSIIADFVKSHEVAAETAIKGVLVAKGFPGPIIDLVFGIANPIINKAAENFQPDDIVGAVDRFIAKPLLGWIGSKLKG